MKRWIWFLAGGVAWASSDGVLACWDEAAAQYRVSPELLYAIAKCESGLRPNVFNRSHSARTGTYDIGLMQINSSHLTRLGELGITERELLDACTNIQVGAWILADKIERYGFSWEAVGAYNAACTTLKGSDCAAARSKYAWCVYRNLPTSSASRASTAPTTSVAQIAPVRPLIAARIAR
jgi:soluble lytic murein transglycosylase-like protein